jgi:hypothetical protein
MITRTILATILAAGTAGAALAEVEVKTPGVNVEAPSGRVDLDIDVGGKVVPSDAWIGRPVYSSDGTHVGEVAAISGDRAFADIGGFLGLGETRVLLGPVQIARVTDDRIELAITASEAGSLPAAAPYPEATQ